MGRCVGDVSINGSCYGHPTAKEAFHEGSKNQELVATERYEIFGVLRDNQKHDVAVVIISTS